jgi:hypothetical protein
MSFGRNKKGRAVGFVRVPGGSAAGSSLADVQAVCQDAENTDAAQALAAFVTLDGFFGQAGVAEFALEFSFFVLQVHDVQLLVHGVQPFLRVDGYTMAQFICSFIIRRDEIRSDFRRRRCSRMTSEFIRQVGFQAVRGGGTRLPSAPHRVQL